MSPSWCGQIHLNKGWQKTTSSKPAEGSCQRWRQWWQPGEETPTVSERDLNYTRCKTTTSSQPTFVATARIATPCRMGCQAPMSWAFSGTTRRDWVVIFQASTRISHRLLNSARRGANGKDATNRVTKPNWITANRPKKMLKCSSPKNEHVLLIYYPASQSDFSIFFRWFFC